MTFEDFTKSLQQPAPPPGLTPLLIAMWHDGKGDWEASHNVAQDIHSASGSWIHAYLHRKEGDPGNAAYWYRKAGKPVANGSLEKEWETIVRELL